MTYRFYLYHADIGKYTRIKDPVGWNSLGKTIKRDMAWHGIFFDYAPKLKFVKDGKEFIKFYYEKYGIEAVIILKIMKRDTATGDYQEDYIGRLNLTSYHVGTIYVECNVESSSAILQTLKNKADVKVAMTDLVSIPLHSQILKKEAVTGEEGVNYNTESDYVTLGTGLRYLMFDPGFKTDEINERFDYGTQISTVEPISNYKYLYKVKEAGDYEFDMRFAVTIQALGINQLTATLAYKLVTGRPGSYTTTTLTGSGTGVGVPTSTLFVRMDATVINATLNAGDEVYLFGELNVSASAGTFKFRLDMTRATYNEHLTITALTSSPASTCNASLKFESFTRVMEGITGKTDRFRSTYFGRTENGYAEDGAGSLRCNTNGFQVRTIDKPVYLSLKDLITTAQAIDGVGFGIIKTDGIERLYAEPLSFWYQAKRMMRLDYVKDIEKDVLSEMYYNEIEGGIDKWDSTPGQTANLDEFNARKEWTLPITQLKKKLILKSPYITSGYQIEATRRQNTEPTKNTERDNDVFEINLLRNFGVLEPLKDQGFSSVTGVISPTTSYNLGLSPARCLRRNGQMIRAALEKQKDQNIVFSFGEGNNDMITQMYLEPAPIAENGNILISSLDKPLFFPEVYTIKAKLTRQQLIDLNTTDPAAEVNVWQFVEFSDSNKNYKRGYVLQAKPAPNSNETELMLLRANL